MNPLVLLFSLLLASFVSSSPVPEDRRRAPPKKKDDFVDYGKKIAAGTCGKCDLSKAVLPQSAVALPPPSAGLSLSHVAVGRGTQNYTCDLSNTTAIPVAAGAVATLFNVSCLSVESPDLVAKAANVALDLPIPYDVQDDDEDKPAYYGLSGYHYFLDSTTPFFNLDTDKHAYGEGAFKKSDQTPAPADAMVGQKNKGFGAVPWLKLKAASGYGPQGLQEVYRVRTAGGSPPKTCQGQPAKFEIQYATEYWFYS